MVNHGISHYLRLEKEAEFIDTVYLYVRRPTIGNPDLAQASVCELTLYHSAYQLNQYFRINVKEIARSPGYLSKSWELVNTAQTENPLNSSVSMEIDTENKVIFFGPKGQLGLFGQELRGRGIGRFCLARLVSIAIDKGYEGNDVKPLTLSQIDSDTEDAKQLRNNFYLAAGFKLAFDDETERNGHTVRCKLSALNTNWNRAKVRPLSAQTFRRYKHELRHGNS